MDDGRHRLPITGRYSPLRYPGGKGKIAKFVASIVRENQLSDGLYVEPYAGGAAIAWELLLTGVVRRVAINDISKPVYSFWKLVIDEVDWLCKKIQKVELSVAEWDRQKEIYKNPRSSLKKLGFAFFYLNRTNRSGILNAGIIGGRSQESQWKIDARFNRDDLILRIRRIAAYKNKITLTCLDAADFIEQEKPKWQKKTLIYLDPPYYEKGRLLYHDCYKSSDHEKIAKKVMALEAINWIVSYDDVLPIHSLYEDAGWLQYSLSYSAYKKVRGREAMFFSDALKIPNTLSQMQEIDRGAGACNGGTQPKNRVSLPNELS